jgi:hypothetical protein
VIDYIISHAGNDERPYLEIDVLGRKLMGLLDSGATHTVLGSSGWRMIQELGFSLSPGTARNISVANGNVVKCIGVVEVPVQVEDKFHLVQMLVVPDLAHILILGIDFWVKLGVVPDIRRNVWNFSRLAEVATCETGSVLSKDQQSILNGLIAGWVNRMGSSLGCTTLVEHEIKTESPPIKQRYYPVSPHVQRNIDLELDEMLKAGVVEKSTSAWSSPVLLIPKKDGTFRFCVDFRKLNAVTERDAYPLPYISAILDKLRNATFMSSLDIKSAFWQVPVAEKSRDYLSFTVPGRGLFRFLRMPFGLHNAPATWQRLIDSVLGPELEPFVFVYLDDIIVITPTFEKHCEILQDIFDRLLAANLTVSMDKCQFCREELKYLGYVVDRQGIRVDADKVNCILTLLAPKNPKEVRSFIGMASWYRKFIPNFSTLLSPLTALIKKNSKFLWTEQCQSVFDKIKTALVSSPILRCPNFDLPFVLQTDASGYGIGGVLSQTDEGGEHVICYLSRTLSSCEKKYSTTERECLAVIWAIEKLRPYLEGSVFSVITDHHSLVWLNNLKDPQGRLARWAVRLQQFNFTITHRKGKDHVVPDYLSRGVPEVSAVVADKLGQQAESIDKWYRGMIRKVEEYPLKYRNWRVTDQKLYKYLKNEFVNLGDVGDQWKEVVPKERRRELLFRFHDSPTSGHVGIYKTYNRLTEGFYWPKMKRDVTRYIKCCHTCQTVKSEAKKPAGCMLSNPKVSRPWQVISADLVGPFPKSTNGFMHVLVVGDYFSKFSLFFPLRRATSAAVIRKLEDEVFLMYGAPQYLLTDNGKQFVSRDFKTLCSTYGVKNRFNAVYHPQANPVERVNRVLKAMLISYVGDNQRLWDRELPKIGCAIRTARHEVTGFTPYFMNFGRHQVLKGTDFKGNIDFGTLAFDRTLVSARSAAFPSLFEKVKARLKASYEKNKKAYDLRKRSDEFNEGDLVLRRNMLLSDASRYYSAKLAKKYLGPYRVRKKLSLWTYELVDEYGKVKGVWHAKDMKPYVTGTSDDD